MSTARNDSCQILAENIADLLAPGLVLLDSDLDCLESTLGVSGPDELEALLGPGGSGDKESLLDMILFPGREAKLRLEEVIEEHAFGAGDLGEVAERLTRLLPSIRVVLGLSGPSLECELPREAAAQYVRRLRIGKRLDPDLVRRIDGLLPRDDALAAKVALRAARIEWSEEKLDFLHRFLQAYASASRWEELRAYLQAAIELLEEAEPGWDLFQQLANKRLYLKRTLERADIQEEQLKKQNVETLMMQRVNILCIDRSEVQRSMDVLDDIGATVFGRSPAELQHPSSFYFPI
jgi:hypothetical protein